MLDGITKLLAPHTCVVCGREGSLLCVWCWPDALPAMPERCYRCSATSPESEVCKKCRASTPLRHAWVRAQYEGAAKDLVYALKFARAQAAALTIAELLDEAVPALPEGTIITYVPTATSRVRFRGYDQSRLIAKSFARHRGLKLQTLLSRHGQSRQVGADRKHRAAQAAQNYRLVPTAQISGKEVVVIDDILTTGATLESAARILKDAGAKQVNAAVFAQKQ